MYSMREHVMPIREIPLPSGATLARRIGNLLCIADKQNYSMVNLDTATILPFVPVSQAEIMTAIKPSITIISENEFLVTSWTGDGTIGLFVTGEGDPVRGTLEWPSHPEAVCFDYPYVTTLLQNSNVEIHSIETQAIVQVISPSPREEIAFRRLNLISSLNGYLVPAHQASDKMRTTSIRLCRVPENSLQPESCT